MDAEQRQQLLDKLHGNAGIGMPVAGSSALACYQHLYALYFSDKEYLKAATVAYSLYSALDRSLRRSGEALPAMSLAVAPVLEQQRAALLMLISARARHFALMVRPQEWNGALCAKRAAFHMRAWSRPVQAS
ncbi:unnamed protein product [Effrenium voratum]|uniref:Uncharacterized protein n=1 Tax=Effrenium voratum TaxID=2562239 RepID=A0AA36MWT9_9DINO|nr:unnamed protein product [Effrenium voratum]